MNQKKRQKYLSLMLECQKDLSLSMTCLQGVLMVFISKW